MKRLIRLPYFFRFVILILLSSACDDDDKDVKSIAQSQMEKMTGKWHAVSVTLDDTQQEGWEDFTMTISPVANADREKLSYIIANNPYVTPWISVTTGSFTFDQDDPEHYILREDGLPIEYEVSPDVLLLRFTYQDPAPGGRISGVGGEWEFRFEVIRD